MGRLFKRVQQLSLLVEGSWECSNSHGPTTVTAVTVVTAVTAEELGWDPGSAHPHGRPRPKRIRQTARRATMQLEGQRSRRCVARGPRAIVPCLWRSKTTSASLSDRLRGCMSTRGAGGAASSRSKQGLHCCRQQCRSRNQPIRYGPLNCWDVSGSCTVTL